jgi:hypothetical protein
MFIVRSIESFYLEHEKILVGFDKKSFFVFKPWQHVLFDSFSRVCSPGTQRSSPYRIRFVLPTWMPRFDVLVTTPKTDQLVGSLQCMYRAMETETMKIA